MVEVLTFQCWGGGSTAFHQTFVKHTYCLHLYYRTKFVTFYVPCAVMSALFNGCTMNQLSFLAGVWQEGLAVV